MASSSSARFTIDVDGIPKVLLSIRLSKSDDLYLMLRRARKFRDFGCADEDSNAKTPLHGGDILEQRYSVHPSLHLPKENVIHHTLRVSGSRPVETSHYTFALKSGDRFAMLYARRAPDLSINIYNMKSDNVENINVGKYEPTRFTLFYSVFVGKRGLAFDLSEIGTDISINVVFYDIGPYRVVLCTSFLSLPSDGTGALVHILTINPFNFSSDEERYIYSGFRSGLFPIQSLAMMTKIFITMADEMISIIGNKILVEDPNIKFVFDTRDFYSEGFRGSPSWDIICKKLISVGFR